MEDLLEDAKDDDAELYVKSAYRSFEEQSALKSAYSVTYGAGMANQFSADQGYSEHQLGTTVDFITKGLGGKLEGFEKQHLTLGCVNMRTNTGLYFRTHKTMGTTFLNHGIGGMLE